MHTIESRQLESLVDPVIQERIDAVRERPEFQNYSDVIAAAANTQSIEPGERTSRAYIVDPDGDVDESNTIVLALPHLNGWTPHHYVRAKTTQQIVAPNSRVVVLPNNSHDQTNYDISQFNPGERGSLYRGEMTAFGRQQLRTLEVVSQRVELGRISLTGYSHGAKTVLAMGGENRDRFDIAAINADETPSKKDRTPCRLGIDFIRTAGSLGKAVKTSEIPALSSAMRFDRRNKDIARFMLMNVTNEGKLMTAAMSKDAKFEMYRSAHDARISTKVGYVEGSTIFDPSVAEDRCLDNVDNLRFVRYAGKNLFKHASGDNVISHALMVLDGLTVR